MLFEEGPDEDGVLDADDPAVRARIMAELERQAAPERDLGLMQTNVNMRPWRVPHRERFDRPAEVHTLDVAGRTLRYSDQACLGHSGDITLTGRMAWDAALGRWRAHLIASQNSFCCDDVALLYQPLHLRTLKSHTSSCAECGCRWCHLYLSAHVYLYSTPRLPAADDNIRLITRWLILYLLTL